MPPALPAAFLDRPVAHRALHGPGRAENSLAAIDAAMQAGFPAEIDVQLTRDGRAVVFHDDALDRLTGDKGRVRERTAEERSIVWLKGGGGAIPTLDAVLRRVNGQIPLLIEIKDQTGALGADTGPLERAVGDALDDYRGPVAVMSFNPDSVARMASHASTVPRGLVTDPFEPKDWPDVPMSRLAHLRAIGDLSRAGASFVSHKATDLRTPALDKVRDAGLPILCWTIRSAGDEAAARAAGAANVTFEGYLPQVP